MGLIASGSVQPNITGVTGNITDAGVGFTGVTGAIYALVDCRNASGITFSEEHIMPTITAITGGVPRIEFAFYKSNQIPYSIPGSGLFRNLADVTTFPINGATGFTTGLIQRLSYFYTTTGLQPQFKDVVPVLGPWCVISIYTSGVNTVDLGAGVSFTPMVLGNTRSQYDGYNKGTVLLTDSVAVGAGLTVSSNPVSNYIGSGEIVIQGSSSVSATTQSIGVVANYIGPTGVAVSTLLTRLVSDGAGNFIQQRLVHPRGTLSLALFNGTAGAITMSYTILKGSF